MIPAPLHELPWGVRTPDDRRASFTSFVTLAASSLREDGTARWLTDELLPMPGRGAATWITARMTHVLSLGAVLGIDGAGTAAQRAVSGLDRVLRDPVYGGWFSAVGPEGPDGPDGSKQAYAHAFVVLAAATASAAEVPGATELLTDALDVLDRRFWEPTHGLHSDARSRDWESTDPYRGVNANMHAVEALLAASDVTAEPRWRERAERIIERVVEWSAANEWRIPEHFDAGWQVQLELNADRPRDPFKPYGATPGHGLEWARLMLQADVAAGAEGRHTASAQALYRRAVDDAWDVERGGGFVYTTDWTGSPVEDRRFHWVAAEAVAAAEVLHRATGAASYAEDAAAWWEWIDTHLVDRRDGSWFHELDTQNRPSPRTWIGKPDVYHAAQALLLPDLPLAGSFAGGALRAVSP